MLLQSILLGTLGLAAVLLYFAVVSLWPRWIRWTALGLSIVLPLLALLPILVPKQLEVMHNQAIQADLDQHRAVWEAHKPSRYRMTVHTVIFCPANDCPTEENTTAEELFSRAQSGINQGYPVSVTYDPELGYPTNVYIDRGYSRDENGFESWATDQGVGYFVTHFELLP